jgi:hypothetical protein
MRILVAIWTIDNLALVMLEKAIITWSNHRQGSTVDSTQQTKYIACAKSVNCTDWLVRLLLDL